MVIVFYDCGTGALEQRNCESIQFYTGYTVPNGFPLATTSKWDTEKRYARAYTYVQRDKTTNARIEIDVLIAGTGTDPAKTFRAYFTKMENSAGRIPHADRLLDALHPDQVRRRRQLTTTNPIRRKAPRRSSSVVVARLDRATPYSSAS